MMNGGVYVYMPETFLTTTKFGNVLVCRVSVFLMKTELRTNLNRRILGSLILSELVFRHTELEFHSGATHSIQLITCQRIYFRLK